MTCSLPLKVDTARAHHPQMTGLESKVLYDPKMNGEVSTSILTAVGHF